MSRPPPLSSIRRRSIASRSSSAIAAADAGRSFGSLAIERWITRSIDPIPGVPLSGAGCSYAQAWNTSMGLDPGKARLPDIISYRIAPHENRSLRGPTSSARHCSGAM